MWATWTEPGTDRKSGGSAEEFLKRLHAMAPSQRARIIATLRWSIFPPPAEATARKYEQRIEQLESLADDEGIVMSPSPVRTSGNS